MSRSDHWPASPDPEIDGYTWEFGPNDDDRRWAAAQNGDHHTDEPTPRSVLDRQAEEAEAQEHLDQGCLP